MRGEAYPEPGKEVAQGRRRREPTRHRPEYGHRVMSEPPSGQVFLLPVGCGWWCRGRRSRPSSPPGGLDHICSRTHLCGIFKQRGLLRTGQSLQTFQEAGGLAGGKPCFFIWSWRKRKKTRLMQSRALLPSPITSPSLDRVVVGDHLSLPSHHTFFHRSRYMCRHCQCGISGRTINKLGICLPVPSSRMFRWPSSSLTVNLSRSHLSL